MSGKLLLAGACLVLVDCALSFDDYPAGLTGAGGASTSSTRASSTTSGGGASTSSSSSSGPGGAGGSPVVSCGSPEKVQTPDLTFPVGISVLDGDVWVADPEQGKLVRASTMSSLSTSNICPMNALFGNYVGPWNVAVTPDVAYWTNSASGEVDQWGYPVGANNPSPLNGSMTANCSTTTATAWGIVADPATDEAYWTAVTVSGSNHSLQIMEGKSGSGPTSLWSGTGVSYALAIDSTDVYWTNYDSKEIRKVSKGGGSSELLAVDDASLLPTGIAVGQGYVYWCNSTEVRRVSTSRTCADDASCDSGTLVASGGNQVWRVAVGANAIYWVVDMGSGGQIMTAGFDGSNATTLAMAQGGTPFLALVDGQYVYWTEDNPGSVQRVLCTPSP